MFITENGLKITGDLNHSDDGLSVALCIRRTAEPPVEPGALLTRNAKGVGEFMVLYAERQYHKSYLLCMVVLHMARVNTRVEISRIPAANNGEKNYRKIVATDLPACIGPGRRHVSNITPDRRQNTMYREALIPAGIARRNDRVMFDGEENVVKNICREHEAHDVLILGSI